MRKSNLTICLFAVLIFAAVPLSNVASQEAGEIDGRLLADRVSDLVLTLTRDGDRPAGEIDDAVLSYLNAPDYVWAAQLDHRTWSIWDRYASENSDDDLWIGQILEIYLSAYNPSDEDTKVRIQGLFGSVVVVEHDVMVPSGQHRTLLSNENYIRLWEDHGPGVRVLLLSSDKKVVINGLIIQRRDIYHAPFSAYPRFTQSWGFDQELNFQLLDCKDQSNNGKACRTPMSETLWEMFIPEPE